MNWKHVQVEYLNTATSYNNRKYNSTINRNTKHLYVHVRHRILVHKELIVV